MKQTIWLAPLVLLAGCSQPASAPDTSATPPSQTQTQNQTTNPPDSSQPGITENPDRPARMPENTTPNLPARAGAEAELVGKWAGADIQGDLAIQFSPDHRVQLTSQTLEAEGSWTMNGRSVEITIQTRTGGTSTNTENGRTATLSEDGKHLTMQSGSQVVDLQKL